MLKEFSSLRMKMSVYDSTGMDMQQKQIQMLFRDLFDVPIVKGEIMEITFPALANVDLKFQHTIGRVPQGYIPIALNAAGIIYTSPTQIQFPEKEIILRANIASLKAKIWIF